MQKENDRKMMEISNGDWKKYREKISNWQERYMERLVQDYVALLEGEENASDKFWKLENRIKQDKKCPGVLIEMKKSNAIFDIVHLINDEVITLEDLKEFSPELQEVVNFIVNRR